MQVTTRDDLTAWLDGLAGHLTLIAPKTVEQRVLYRPVADSSEIAFDFARTDLPVKEHFLPPTHVLLSIEKGKEGVRLGEPSPERERVVFGLRPCDARALHVLDALFLKEPADPYYAERREKTTLVGLACREMGEQCFCTSLGLAPDEAGDVDVMLTEMEEGGGEGERGRGREGGRRYAVQVMTEKGAAILGALNLEKVEGALPVPAAGSKTPVLEAEAWPRLFDHAYWARLADRCLSCRLCTYVCPTCRCFDVRDYEVPCEGASSGGASNGSAPGGRIERLRAWDSCMAEGYRRIAGGHNPRLTKGDRLRNRLYCKFCYYPQDYGPVACVGCGRCIAMCPVNVDVVEVLADVATL